MKKIDHVILSGTQCSRRISTYLFFSVLVAFLAACSGEGGNSANPSDDDPTTLSSAEGQGSSSSGSVSSAGSETLSSSSRCAGASEECDEAISSDSNAESNGAGLSNSSEQDAKSGSSENLPGSSSDSVDEVESSLGSELFDGSLPKEAYLNPEIQYDSIVDERDGQVYKTVKIGDQTWMAENLNYADSVSTPSLKGKSWCYESRAENCAVAGRLYTWAAAIDSVALYDSGDGVDCGDGKTCTLPEKVQGVCPSGWHLPTDAEWKTLFDEVGGQSNAGKVLKSQTGWFSNGGGTDAYGFFALPAGNWYYAGLFINDGRFALFWSATEYCSSGAYNVFLYYGNDVAYLDYDNKYYGLSVRCLKD